MEEVAPMGLLEQLTPGQILTLVIGILLAAAGAVNTVLPA